MKSLSRYAGATVYAFRWMLYPVNIALAVALAVYIFAFLSNTYHFLISGYTSDMEVLMIHLLGFVDAAMVANLIIMIIQGGHKIFIHSFETNPEERAQWLDHIDSGILKVKVALSIAGITLIQVLKDFVNIEKVDWILIERRIFIHVIALFSAICMAWIWRITHPPEVHHEK